MRKLHLVGVTADLKGLIFTARRGSKSGGYLVALDSKLLEAVEGSSARRIGDSPVAPRAQQADKSEKAAAADDGSGAAGASEAGDGRVASTLSPREMQARMRAGRSIEEVASEAGVGADWVARFAVPILAEQAQIVALARGLTFSKPRLGPSALPLGKAVGRNLAERGLRLPDDLFDPAWSAHQLHDSVWTVRFRHEVRGRPYEAQWELDVPTGRLMARNRVASDLGYVDPGGRRRPAGSSADGALDGAESATGADPPRPRGSGGGPRRPASGRISDKGAPSVGKAGGSRSTRNPTSSSRSSARGATSPAAPRRAAGHQASPKASPAGGPKSSTSSEKSKGDAGPPVRGGGIRAATAQVASAQVAASRSLVARTVLPAPGPSVVRGTGTRGSMGSSATGRSSTAARPNPGVPRPASPPRNQVDMPARRNPSPPDTDRRSPGRTSEPDALIDDLLRDSEPASHEVDHQARSDHRDSADATGPRFQPASRPDGSPPGTVTRVRSGGPTGLVRTTSNPTGAGPKSGDTGAGNGSGGSRKRVDNREPVRVPSVLSPVAGPDRGMPTPRPRSRRLLRRPR